MGRPCGRRLETSCIRCQRTQIPAQHVSTEIDGQRRCGDRPYGDLSVRLAFCFSAAVEMDWIFWDTRY